MTDLQLHTLKTENRICLLILCCFFICLFSVNPHSLGHRLWHVMQLHISDTPKWTTYIHVFQIHFLLLIQSDLICQERAENSVYTSINSLDQTPGTTWTVFCAAVSNILGRADIFKIKYRVQIITKEKSVDFMDVKTPGNRSQALHSALWASLSV